ncbi:glycosyltransferase [Roseomonas elaeocarpi]|uniref:Glycosyltransferase n=1 Tax=Roseomonas elaeocarpi TaxID=907779 RepID=A0ABV6JQW1_9PROT
MTPPLLRALPTTLVPLRGVVAIPARNEQDRIAGCLRALAEQVGEDGSPLPPGSFGVLLLANNCTDRTASVAEAMAPELPFPLRVVEAVLEPARAHVGWARRLSLDAAADWASRASTTPHKAAILGTDADGRVSRGWVQALLRPLERGHDAAAGTFRVDEREGERLLPLATRRRYALEDHYALLIDQLASLLDPDPDDPWPRHDTHSGASFALTVAAYRRIGGLRPCQVCEDRHLFWDLRMQDQRIRHVLDAEVEVSARLESRATGGWGDTTRLRVEQPDGIVDARLEPLPMALRRITARRRARRLWEQVRDAAPLSDAEIRRFCAQVGLMPKVAIGHLFNRVFGSAWAAVEISSPALQKVDLPPARLDAEIAAAERLLSRMLRAEEDQPMRRSTSSR